MMLRAPKRRRLWGVVLLTVVLLALWVTKWMCDKAASRLIVSTNSPRLRTSESPIAWVRGKNQHTGYLLHVHQVLIFLGYIIVNYTDEEGTYKPWDLLWCHSYPFKELRGLMAHLQSHQKVNHFPGTGFISNKVTLAESGLKSMPRAFRIPKDRNKLLDYAKLHPDTLFVQKSNNHRGIVIKPLPELDLTDQGSFVQEFIHNPLLIDGHKFDIGVYVVLTSVRPLRVYMHWGDVLFRFCPEKYHPFDPAVRDKYVVGDDYLPMWKVSSLIPYHTLQGFGMKQSFDAWLRDQDKRCAGGIVLETSPLEKCNRRRDKVSPEVRRRGELVETIKREAALPHIHLVTQSASSTTVSTTTPHSRLRFGARSIIVVGLSRALLEGVTAEENEGVEDDDENENEEDEENGVFTVTRRLFRLGFKDHSKDWPIMEWRMDWSELRNHSNNRLIATHGLSNLERQAP
ncbi:Tubulin-tyrosine ligase/Tubulin polyglutamylase [Trinorchestia longiramus]|nr:Tubulin-tyrosine ligase/Tubulin polyglutamylase [Trinorchestia longiramus]